MIALTRMGGDRRAAWAAVVIFSVILTIPTVAELSVLGAFACLGLWYLPRLGGGRMTLALLTAFVLLVTNAVMYVFQDYNVDTYSFFAELKILTFLFVPSFIYVAFVFSKKTYMADRIVVLYNIYIPLIFLSTLIGTLAGNHRDSVIFGFSINAAYSIVFLSAYLLEKLSIKMIVLAVIATGLLGSTTAAMLMAVLVALRYKKHWLLSSLVLIVLVSAFYFYSLEFRDKDFLNSDVSQFDRYQITVYISKIIYSNFDIMNYLFGWGAGHQLPYMDPGNFDIISGWFLPSFTQYKIYASATHNEYLRVFLDYGLIGSAAIILFSGKSLPPRVLLFLSLAAITNTTIFSTADILVLSLIAADYRARQRSEGGLHA